MGERESWEELRVSKVDCCRIGQTSGVSKVVSMDQYDITVNLFASGSLKN